MVGRQGRKRGKKPKTKTSSPMMIELGERRSLLRKENGRRRRSSRRRDMKKKRKIFFKNLSLSFSMKLRIALD